jgi:hypothetical protein
MSEDDKKAFTKAPEGLTKRVAPENMDASEESDYPQQQSRDGADNEEFVINNANGNGINPNPIESGNKPEWIDGRKQTEDYIRDASKD